MWRINAVCKKKKYMYIYKASGFPPFFCNLIDLLIDDYLFMIHCIEPWKKESPRHHMLCNFYIWSRYFVLHNGKMLERPRNEEKYHMKSQFHMTFQYY